METTNYPEYMYPLISRYSGWGGGDLGAHQAGFFTMFAADFDKHAVECFRLNFPNHPMYNVDLTQMTVGETLKLAQIPDGKPFGYIGSASCRGASLAGKFDPYNKENLMLLNEPQIISRIEPAFFALENVPSINMGRMKVLKAMFAREVEKCLGDYNLLECTLNANDYLVPQSRKRYIVVGFHKKTGIIPQFPMPELYRPVIHDVLPEIDGIVTGYYKQNFRSVSRPSPTITKTESALKVVDGIMYKLTEEDVLKLCGYPDNWKYTGSRTQVYQRCGNSIMPPFSKAVFGEIYSLLQQHGIEPCRTDELLEITNRTVPVSLEYRIDSSINAI